MMPLGVCGIMTARDEPLFLQNLFLTKTKASGFMFYWARILEPVATIACVVTNNPSFLLDK